MSLMICPDCGHECSTSATACPQCGHPFVRPATVAPKVIVREVPVEKEFPKWIFVPIAVLGAFVIFFLILFLRNGDDETANRNVNVRLATTPITQSTISSSREVATSSTPYSVNPTTLPPSSTTADTQTIQSNSVTISTPVPDKGTMTMEAKVLNRSGAQQTVTKETFYLLDKDLQSILLEAGIDDPEGQGIINSFGLSVVNPAKYREVNQKALAAINRHIIYRTLTDAQGKAEIKDIKPNSYYLFGITKTRTGFAIWDSPVNIQTGQNNVVLEPQTPTEIEMGN
jgi:hypothetical protein